MDIRKRLYPKKTSCVSFRDFFEATVTIGINYVVKRGIGNYTFGNTAHEEKSERRNKGVVIGLAGLRSFVAVLILC